MLRRCYGRVTIVKGHLLLVHPYAMQAMTGRQSTVAAVRLMRPNSKRDRSFASVGAGLNRSPESDWRGMGIRCLWGGHFPKALL